jgi:hypothetical protein
MTYIHNITLKFKHNTTTSPCPTTSTTTTISFGPPPEAMAACKMREQERDRVAGNKAEGSENERLENIVVRKSQERDMAESFM